MVQVIIFSFSKRECEDLAQQMVNLDLTNSKEKKLVQGIFENAMDVLAQEDRNLAQISSILPMLKRGIGIHHSGLLPIVKEVIEILFQEGLLKVSLLVSLDDALKLEHCLPQPPSVAFGQVYGISTDMSKCHNLPLLAGARDQSCAQIPLLVLWGSQVFEINQGVMRHFTNRTA